jgi:integrase
MLTGLKQRGTRWYLRRRVPAELVEAWGSPEVTRALGTSDYKVARKLLPKAWADLDDEFAAKRAALPAQPRADARPDPNAIAARLLLKLRAKRDAAAAAGELPAFNEAMADGLFYEQAVLAGEEAPSADLAKHEGVRNALRALLAGDGALSIQAEAALAAMSPDENPTISELHALWLKQEERPPSTVKEMERAVDRFVRVSGDKRVKAIARRDVTAFSDKMREPGGVTPEGVSIPTTNTTLSLLSALLGFAVKRNLIENNPARGTQLKDTRRAREKRREFDAPALGAIFGSAIYAADERPDGGAGEAAYWLPLLALHTGARINELCQLHPGDVQQEGYTDAKGKPQKAWVVRIEHDRVKGQRVKTEGGERRIPVHPDLVKLGFVKYAQAQAGKPLLFDRLSMGPKETRLAGNWGRWFARYMRDTCGVTDERMTFHSFRHTFKHHMRQCQIPKDVNDALTGHETGDAADAYGGLSFPLFPLVEGMKRYRVDGLSLPKPPPAYRS